MAVTHASGGQGASAPLDPASSLAAGAPTFS